MQYINKTYRRTGTLWDSRYKSSLVRADMTDDPALYRFLFRSELDHEALADIRLALSQGQPLGKGRFIDQVENMLGRRCEVRPRGRPRTVKGSG